MITMKFDICVKHLNRRIKCTLQLDLDGFMHFTSIQSSLFLLLCYGTWFVAPTHLRSGLLFYNYGVISFIRTEHKLCAHQNHILTRIFATIYNCQSITIICLHSPRSFTSKRLKSLCHHKRACNNCYVEALTFTNTTLRLMAVFLILFEQKNRLWICNWSLTTINKATDCIPYTCKCHGQFENGYFPCVNVHTGKSIQHFLRMPG